MIILHSKYVVNNTSELFTISENNKYICDNNNNKIFQLFDIPTNLELYKIYLEIELNILKVKIDINIDLLINLAKEGKYIPDRNIFFNLLRLNKKNQYNISSIIENINKESNNDIDNSESIDNIPFNLYNYQINNVKWMQNIENSNIEFKYLENNFVKIKDLYFDLEKEQILENCEYKKIKFTGGGLIDSENLGKCILPNTFLYVNEKLETIENIWNSNAKNIKKNKNEEIGKCDNLYINCYNKVSKKIEKKLINLLYKQKVNDTINNIKLSNGIEISITQKHKLLTENGWKNNLSVGDKVCISNKFINNSNKYINNYFLLVFKELNYVKELKNYCYIKCKNKNIYRIIEKFLINYNYKIQETKNYIKIVFNDKNILNIINKYDLNSIISSNLNCCKDFINLYLLLSNNKFYSNSYKKMLQYSILLSKIKKKMTIKKFKNGLYYGNNIKNIKSDINFYEITEIEKINYSKYVYDLYVSEHNNYIANNVLCHNTICIMALCHLNPFRENIKNMELEELKINNSYLKSKSNLIIAQNYSCSQWKNEINLNFSKTKKIIYITNKKQYNTITYNDIIHSDFVIISYQFLNNNCYKDIWKQYHNYYNNNLFNIVLDTIKYENMRNKNLLNENCPIIQLIKFNRIIIDDIHELYKFKNIEYFIQIINSIKSNYIWCLSNHPFENCNLKFYNILNILTYSKNTDYLLNKNIRKYIEYNLFRRNTKNSVKNEIVLKKINKIYKPLNFSLTETIIYDFFKLFDNKNNNIFLKYFCCHPNIANKTKILFDKSNTLDEIRNKLLIHVNTIYKEIVDKLNICEIKINNNTNNNNLYNLQNEKKQLIEKKNLIIKYSIFLKTIIPKIKNKQVENCSICLNKIKNNEIIITKCCHIFCNNCINKSINKFHNCPICRENLNNESVFHIDYNNELENLINKNGTKIANIIYYLKNELSNTNKKFIIISHFDKVILKLMNILNEQNIEYLHYKNISELKNKNDCRIILNTFNNNIKLLENKNDFCNIIFINPIYGDNNFIQNIEKQSINHLYNIKNTNNIKIIYFYIKNSIEEQHIKLIN